VAAGGGLERGAAGLEQVEIGQSRAGTVPMADFWPTSRRGIE
jgi:hypothetical protein